MEMYKPYSEGVKISVQQKYPIHKNNRWRGFIQWTNNSGANNSGANNSNAEYSAEILVLSHGFIFKLIIINCE